LIVIAVSLRTMHTRSERVFGANGLADVSCRDYEETGAGQPLHYGTGPDGEPAPHPLAEQRAEVEQAILGNLLRMNLARAV
jgi:hypothetical protein